MSNASHTEGGVFENLAGARTLARLFSAVGQKIYGTFNPQLPYPPLYSADGMNRYGFRQFYNGYVRGPEGTSLSQLQAAVDRGLLPGIHQNSAGAYPRLTLQDYYDSLYLQASNGSSFYDMYVPNEVATTTEPIVEPVVEPPVVTPPTPPISPSVNPTTPPDPCKEISAALAEAEDDLTAYQNKVERLQTEKEAMTSKYTILKADYDSLIKKLDKISNKDVPERGGRWVAVLNDVLFAVRGLVTEAKSKSR